MMRTTVTPLLWLDRRYQNVDRLARLGYQSIHLALLHIARDWGTGPLDIQRYFDLLPNDNVWRLPGRDEHPSTTRCYYSILLEVPYFESTIRPVPMMTARDLAAWWEMYIRPPELSSLEFSSLMGDPAMLVILGYITMRDQFYDESEASPLIGACLSMIGAGAIGALVSDKCQLCQFRRSIFNTKRCKLCSLSKRVVDPVHRAQQAAGIRHSKRILATTDFFSSINMLSDEGPARYFSTMISSMQRGSPAHNAWIQNIETALNSAPLARQLLPPDFMTISHAQQLSALRKAIDPQEWDYSLWPEKIAQAQKWCQAESDLASRRKGPGPAKETVRKAMMARDLLASGMSKTEVAKSMNLTLSHLSHILRRTASLNDE